MDSENCLGLGLKDLSSASSSASRSFVLSLGLKDLSSFNITGCKLLEGVLQVCRQNTVARRYLLSSLYVRLMDDYGFNMHTAAISFLK